MNIKSIIDKIDPMMAIICVTVMVIFYLVYTKFFKKKPAKQTRVNSHRKKNRRRSKDRNRHTKDKHHSKKKHRRTPKEPEDDLVYLDVEINREVIGRVVIRLFSDVVPKTCKNFRTLCNRKNKYNYVGCEFHRIIRDFMIQTGDIDGNGGFSIYGDRFEDENFELSHDRPYMVSMANSAPDTNGSQFFITTVPTMELDGKHVVFGEVISGFDVVDELNEVRTDGTDGPVDRIRIANCGVIN